MPNTKARSRRRAAPVELREPVFPLERQDFTSRTALMEEQAGNGAHKRTTLGPRFKSRNHHQVLATYQMNT